VLAWLERGAVVRHPSRSLFVPIEQNKIKDLWMSNETFEEVEVLARALFHRSTSVGIWAELDYPTQLYWRKEAARKLQADRYKEISQVLIDESR
jgi:hypothetical protein